jgi:hypothetical protein
MIAGYQRALNILNNALYEYYESPSKYYGRTGSGAEEAARFSSAPNIVEQSIQYDNSSVYDIGTEGRLDSAYKIMNNIIMPHLSVQNISSSSDTSVVYKTIGTKDLFDYSTLAGCSADNSSDAVYFYLTNGMRFCMIYNKTDDTSKFGETSYGTIWVDVNGEKGPNKKYSATGTSIDSLTYYGDTFPITILKNRFVPGTAISTESSISEAAEKAYFGEKY